MAPPANGDGVVSMVLAGVEDATTCLDCFLNNGSIPGASSYIGGISYYPVGPWWCPPQAQTFLAGLVRTVAGHPVCFQGRIGHNDSVGSYTPPSVPLGCCATVWQCDNPTTTATVLGCLWLLIALVLVAVFTFYARRYSRRRLQLAVFANALTFGLSFLLACMWWFEMWYGGLVQIRTTSGLKVMWLPLWIFSFLAFQGEIATRGWGEAPSQYLLRMKPGQLWRSNCLGQFGRLLKRITPISRLRLTNLAICALLFCSIAAGAFFEPAGFAIVVSTKPLLYGVIPVILSFLYAVCGHIMPWIHIRWRALQKLAEVVTQEERTVLAGTPGNLGFEYSDAEVLKRPYLLLVTFYLRSVIMVLSAPILASFALGISVMYSDVIRVMGLQQEAGNFRLGNSGEDTYWDYNQFQDGMYTAMLYLGISVLAINFYIFYENNMIFHYWQIAVLKQPAPNRFDSEINTTELPLIIANNESDTEDDSDDNDDDVADDGGSGVNKGASSSSKLETFASMARKRARHPGHILAGIQAISPVMTLLSAGIAALCVVLCVGAFNTQGDGEGFKQSILWGFWFPGRYNLPNYYARKVQALSKPYMVMMSILAALHMLASVLQQYAFASRNRKPDTVVSPSIQSDGSTLLSKEGEGSANHDDDDDHDDHAGEIQVDGTGYSQGSRKGYQERDAILPGTAAPAVVTRVVEQDNRPNFGQNITPEISQAVIEDTFGEGKTRLTRAIFWLASWHGQQFLTLFSHATTLVVTITGLITEEFDATALPFALAATAITGVGTLITALTFTSRLWYILKLFPTDDSFRITILLKASLLVLKALLLLVAPSGYDVVYLALFSVSLITLAIFTFVNVIAAWKRREIFFDVKYPRLLLTGYACCYLWNKVASLTLVATAYILGSSGYRLNGLKQVLILGGVIVFLSYNNNEVARYLQGRLTADRARKRGETQTGVAFYGLAKSCGGLAAVVPYCLLATSAASVVQWIVTASDPVCFAHGNGACRTTGVVYSLLLAVLIVFIVFLQLSLVVGFSPTARKASSRFVSQVVHFIEDATPPKWAAAVVGGGGGGDNPGNGGSAKSNRDGDSGSAASTTR